MNKILLIVMLLATSQYINAKSAMLKFGHFTDKIMQPFFTTKPTGEGTGLGLSLTYDMVVKGHNGQISLETKVGEGTTFIIQIPNA